MNQPPPAFWSAVERVLDQFMEVELANFCNTPSEEREEHVFVSLFVLGCWLDLAERQGGFVRLDS